MDLHKIGWYLNWNFLGLQGIVSRKSLLLANTMNNN